MAANPEFDDGKDPEALRTIGEVATALGIRQHVLRYWEEQFTALRPVKRSGGRRYYRPADVALVAEIDRLVHRDGYTLKGAAKALAGKDNRAEPPTVPITREPAISHLSVGIRAIRNQLADALAQA
ncbi:MerR family transcriptional regulator [Novosphingobium sp. Rr 2-17]|uniref:MerR family transcriptional regulator n=1 Tax=Novosphingobium sp. Rr 2-17 TaxID=555793 RepID=UPI0002697E71|nr:MerR family transcriptional regulator [Novosphingobium sp. Rr 2-17]EIZ80237.1 MerR family transcriptional regulator [Novosphingobium sp. Rr 2-17]